MQPTEEKIRLQENPRYMSRTLGILFFLLFAYTLSYSQSVKFEWVADMGGDLAFSGDVETDANGNVISAGWFGGDSIDFDPGVGTHYLGNTFPYWNGYIQKLSPNKNLIWAHSFERAYMQDLSVDNFGNIYATGYFYDTVDFDPDTTVFNLISNSVYNAFILKLDANGSFIWVKEIEGTNTIQGQNIEVDQNGNVISSGTFEGSADFDPGTSTHLMIASVYNDIYVQKLDSNGNFLWSKSFGTDTVDFTTSIAVDASGSIYSCGHFSDSINLDPANPSVKIANNGYSYDIYIQKLDQNGNHIWSKTIAGSSNDFATALVESNQNVYVTGRFEGSNEVDFDPGIDTAFLSPVSGQSSFILKLNTSGNFKWAKSIQGWSSGLDIKVDANGNVLTLACCDGDSDFDPSDDEYFINEGTGDYLHKLDSSGEFIFAKRIAFCSYYAQSLSHLTIDQSQNIFIYGVFSNNNDFDPGVGTYYLNAPNNSIHYYVLKLAPCTPDFHIDTATVCDSYSWSDGNTYTSSGTYWNFNSNANNCDSTKKLVLTVKYSDSIMSKKTVCSSYTWIDGITYTTNIRKSLVFTNAAGCDSTQWLTLKIKGPRKDVTVNQSSLFARESVANYQWLDCDNNMAVIQGATDRLFQPEKNGNYAVALFKSNCRDTSECYRITSLSIQEEKEPEISIYPVPFEHEIYIQTGQEKIEEIQILDQNGKMVFQKFEMNNGNKIHVNLPSGIYLMNIVTTIGEYRRKIVRR